MLVFKKEKHARKLVLGHLDTVQDCLRETREALEAFIAGDKDAVRAKRELVGGIESKADAQRREIRDVLLDGAFLPHIRSDIFRLVGCIDDIANKAEGLARFLANQPPDLPDEYKPDVHLLLQHSLDSFGALRKALRDYLKPKGILENLHVHVTRAAELESRVDEIESALMKRIFSSDIDLSRKLHLEQLVKRIGAIADLTEDAADELEFAAMKSVV
jgi:predicted phosphate transport protein (TIGR00153 family)